MNFKSKKFLIPLISIIILTTGFGAFLGRYYFTAKNLVIEIESMDIIDIEHGGSFLNPTYNIELDLQGTIQSITALNISVDSVSYTMKIDGKDFGPGVVDSFKASKNPSPLLLHHTVEDIGLDHYSAIVSFLIGEDITVEITLLTVLMMGITFKLNSVSSFVINVNDL